MPTNKEKKNAADRERLKRQREANRQKNLKRVELLCALNRLPELYHAIDSAGLGEDQPGWKRRLAKVGAPKRPAASRPKSSPEEILLELTGSSMDVEVAGAMQIPGAGSGPARKGSDNNSMEAAS
jgi:hypothetical protein